MAKWFCVIDKREMGPLESAELARLAKTGRLKPDDRVRREDMNEWHSAKNIKGLFSADGAQSPSPKTANSNTAVDTIDQVGSASNGQGLNSEASKSKTNDKVAPDDSAHLKDRFTSVWTDIRSLNFWEEIVPIDSTNIGRMIRDPVILAVITSAIAPLVIVTLPSKEQLACFALLFAFVWGMVFKHYIVRANVSWKVLLGSLLFTGVIGMNLLLTLYATATPRAYYEMPDSKNPVVSLFGFVFRVGICEELCKVLPVVLYLLWKRQRANPMTCLLVGIFSGLGFAAFENLQYHVRAIERTFQTTSAFSQIGIGEYILKEGVRGAMVEVLLRSLSLVFCHALWTGIFSYFLIVAALTGRKIIALVLVGLIISATLHGVYDWLAGQQQTFAAAVMIFAFVLFYAYRLKLQALTEEVGNAEQQLL
jgi:protease PrsW